jgi:hypothetical protein
MHELTSRGQAREEEKRPKAGGAVAMGQHRAWSTLKYLQLHREPPGSGTIVVI